MWRESALKLATLLVANVLSLLRVIVLNVSLWLHVAFDRI